jgi:biotin carboxyl carrier protein
MNYTHNDQSYNVRLQRHPDGTYTAHINGQTHTVKITPQADNALLIQTDSALSRVVAVADGDSRHVHHNGQSVTLTAESAQSSARRRRASGGSGTLSAQMPGQVVDVLVAEGDTVTAHQTLIVLEAMKMEIRITAPHDGLVQAIHTTRGAVVERGQTLIDLTPIH